MPFAKRTSWSQDEGYDPGGYTESFGSDLPGGTGNELYNPGGSSYWRGTPSYNPEALGNKPFKIPATPISAGGGYGPEAYPGQPPMTQPYYGMPNVVGGGPGGGGYGITGPLNATTPNIPLPEMKLPPFDESRISELEQKAAAPGMRALRQSVREVQGKYYENPNVKRMTLRDALAGYGAGIENVMTGARREAQAQYEEEYRPQVQKAQMEYQAQVQGVMNQYQNAWKDYMARLGSSRF